MGGEQLALVDVLAMLRADGMRILSEGGPSLISRFLAEGALDELFLTRSPLLLGRQEGAMAGSFHSTPNSRSLAIHTCASRITGSPCSGKCCFPKLSM